MMRESSTDRLKKLEAIERDLTNALASAGQALAELGKDKPSAKVLENNANSFIREISKVEHELNEQIQYLTQVSSGQAHEGSSYASQKVVAMAWHRLEHTKTRLSELERSAPPVHPNLSAQMVQNRPQMPQNPPGPPPPPTPLHPSQGMHQMPQPQMMQNQMQQPQQQQQQMQQHVPLPPPQLQPQQQPQMMPQGAPQVHPHQMHYNM